MKKIIGVLIMLSAGFAAACFYNEQHDPTTARAVVVYGPGSTTQAASQSK